MTSILLIAVILLFAPRAHGDSLHIEARSTVRRLVRCLSTMTELAGQADTCVLYLPDWALDDIACRAPGLIVTSATEPDSGCGEMPGAHDLYCAGLVVADSRGLDTLRELGRLQLIAQLTNQTGHVIPWRLAIGFPSGIPTHTDLPAISASKPQFCEDDVIVCVLASNRSRPLPPLQICSQQFPEQAAGLGMSSQQSDSADSDLAMPQGHSREHRADAAARRTAANISNGEAKRAHVETPPVPLVGNHATGQAPSDLPVLELEDGSIVSVKRMGWISDFRGNMYVNDNGDLVPRR